MKWLLNLSFILLGFLGFFSTGCSNNPPLIHEVWWLPVLVVEPEGKTHRELILYVHVDDKEGNADLAELRLESEEREIIWNIPYTQWSSWDQNGELWIGSSQISGGLNFLEEGAYQIVLEDKGGRLGKYPLNLENWPKDQDLKNHYITQTGKRNKTLIDSTGQDWFLLADKDDEKGNKNNLISCPVNDFFYPEDYLADEIESFHCFFFNRDEMWGLRMGPYFSSSAE